LPRLRDRSRPGDQDDRHRARERRPGRHHAGAHVHGAGGPDPAGRPAVAGAPPPQRAARAAGAGEHDVSSLRSAGACATVVTAPVRRPALIRLALAALAIALAIGIAAGAIAVPNFARALSDAVDSVGAWIYVAVPALIFFE